MKFKPISTSICVVTIAFFGGMAWAADAGTVDEYVLRAGNADTDAERLEILEELSEQPGLDQQVKADVDRLIQEVIKYMTNHRMEYFSMDYVRAVSYTHLTLPTN